MALALTGAAGLGIGLYVSASAAAPATAAPAATSTAIPPIRHVFIIVEENESDSATFGANSPAPYLANTLRSEGAYLPNYYGIGHESNDNYIAMISGQAPNPQTQADCQDFDNFTPDTIGSYGQAVGSGCVFPADIKTVADQLDTAGLTWRDYNESMGSNPSREAAECGHPGIGQRDGTQSATAQDQYATRHDPFVYFHSIIDDTARCNSHVVNLDGLAQDLQSAASTPNYVFITPDLCDDGHDATCADPSRPGGFAGIDSFLKKWVPRITSSPAFKQQNGLLAIIFDEAATSDTSSCCGEIPGPNSPKPGINGAGGGDTGAVLLSPCIKPGTVSTEAYNHYTLLRSVEDIFALPHLGYAQLPGERSFGSDVFTGSCSAPSPGLLVKLRAPRLASSASTGLSALLTWSATGTGAGGFMVQVQKLSGSNHAWRTLQARGLRKRIRFHGRAGITYEFRVRAISSTGATGAWATATTVMPSGIRPRGAHYHGVWRTKRVRRGWMHRAIIGSKRGSRFTLAYVGGALAVIGELSPGGGVARVVLDGRSRTLRLRSGRTVFRRVLYRASVRRGRHRLTIEVLRGNVALEGFAITNRSR